MSIQKKVILIAEDDEALGDMMRQVLARHGVDVTIVRNGKEAIAAIDRKQPNLLLLDILMPEVDGYGVLRHIREKKYVIPTVIVSNLSSANDQETCREFGCKAFIVKSDIDDSALWPAIEKYIR